jgi:hypothetical protein
LIDEDEAAAEYEGTNAYAVAALAVGLAWFAGVGSVLAIVMGWLAHREIEAAEHRQRGWALATAGQVLGWVGLVGAVWLVAYLLLHGRG